MPLEIVVVMDPIGSINIAKDSTFAMLLEAQRRGHRLLYVRPGGLAVDNGTAVRLERVPTDLTLNFQDSLFSGNGTDIDNLCRQPIDITQAVFE